MRLAARGNHRFVQSLALLALAFAPVAGAAIHLSRSTIAGGGGGSSNAPASVRLRSTVGQSAAGIDLKGGPFSMHVGFWPAPPPARLVNVSTRLQVETGENVLIGGFIISGTQPKKVMLRALGASLPVADKLLSPLLELHDSTGKLIAQNNGWTTAANKQAVIDSKIPPTDERESAVLETIPPGSYTVIVSGANSSTGTGSVEIYDLDTTVDSDLSNFSTRGLVKRADDVVIGGFILAGSASRKVIVRALGPSLALEGKLADPTLELFDQNGSSLASNDNWRSDHQAEITATGIAPTSDLESAIVSTLPAGAYTAVTHGANTATGVAVVEVYVLP